MSGQECQGSGYVDSPHGARYAHPCPGCHAREARDRLIVSRLSLVRALATQMAAKCPRADRDDLIGYGAIGLVQAALRYDGSKGAKFDSFAYRRVWGAMLDGVRTMSWFPRRAPRDLSMSYADDRITAPTNERAPL